MGLQRAGHNWVTKQQQQPCHSIAGEWDRKEWSHSRSNPCPRQLPGTAHQVGVLSFMQERIQEWATVKEEWVYLIPHHIAKCSLRQMLKMKLWYFGHLMQSANSLKNTLTLGKIEGRRRRGRQRKRWLDLMDMRLSKLWEIVKNREAWGAAVRGVANSWTWLNGWTTTDPQK